MVIDNVRPQLDGGRFPVKRTRGETVEVKADVFADGHDHIRVELLHRREDQRTWKSSQITGQSPSSHSVAPQARLSWQVPSPTGL